MSWMRSAITSTLGRAFLSLDFTEVGKLDVVNLEATGSTFTTRLEVESDDTLQVEDAVFLGVRRLVVRELAEGTERHEESGLALRSTDVGNEDFVAGVLHLHGDGLPCLFGVHVEHDAPVLGPVTVGGRALALFHVEHDVDPVSEEVVFDLEAVAVHVRASANAMLQLRLRTKGRFPEFACVLAFEVGNHEILLVGLEVIPLEVRVNPVDVRGERDLVDEDGHRSRLARFALVFALAHGEADFLNLVPLHVLGDFGLLISIPSLALVHEALQRNLHELPILADLDPVIEADLGLALHVVALVVEDTHVQLFAAELTLDPEVEAALVADLGEVDVLAFTERVGHAGPVVVVDVHGEHIAVALSLGLGFALGGKATVAVAEALELVVVERGEGLSLAVKLFRVLRAVDDVLVFIPVDHLLLRRSLLAALHDLDVVHPDVEVAGAALVDGEADFSNLVPVDTGREFGLAGVVPVETAVREVHERNGNLLPVLRHGATLDVLVHREHDLRLLAITDFFVEEADLHVFAAFLALDHELDLGIEHVLVQVEEFVVKADGRTGVFPRVQVDMQGSLGLVTAILRDGDALALAAVCVVETTLAILFVEELVHDSLRLFRLSHCSHAHTQEDDGRDFQCLLDHISFLVVCVLCLLEFKLLAQKMRRARKLSVHA